MLVLPYLFLIAGDLILKLADALSRGAQRICFAIESFVAVATHATALVEKVAAKVERVGSLRNSIFSVTLLAAGLRILFLKHRPEPELVTAVALHITGRRAAITPVTTRTAKPIRRMNLQDF